MSLKIIGASQKRLSRSLGEMSPPSWIGNCYWVPNLSREASDVEITRDLESEEVAGHNTFLTASPLHRLEGQRVWFPEGQPTPYAGAVAPNQRQKASTVG